MDLLDLPDNPIPEGAVVTELKTIDDVRLRAARWRHRSGDALGTVCIFPGRAEQIEKYFHVVEKLLARGFAVAVLDWRGQGGSQRLTRDPRKGHATSFNDFRRDIEVFRKSFVLPDCPAPYFGLAHSMGGLIVLGAAPGLSSWLSRLVLTSPLLGFPSWSPPHGRVRLFARSLCALGLGRMDAPGQVARMRRMAEFEGNPLTSDTVRHAVMKAITKARPDLSIGPPTVQWVKQAALAIDRVNAESFPGAVRVPVMLVNAGADGVVSPVAVETMARRLRNPAYVLIPGARHEILMERDVYQTQFWAAFDAFVPGTAV
ncbi:alpha/beta fold hydrolase [Oryzibacter oryziterrae]|uniref:alpha/beta fold hydrolase n=1 Tax=Oryzibacter oryziterrae TaxID=2766474 RepID=UPI001F18C442|nr:alpha/beta hydrolase [Oryzibacter oryziterrae]